MFSADAHHEPPSEPRHRETGTTAAHCIIAVVAAAAAVLIRHLLTPWLGHQVPFVTLFGAVALVVWLGGWIPACITAAIGYLAITFIVVHPDQALTQYAGHIISAITFWISVGMIIGLGEAMRRSRRLAEQRGDQLLEEVRQRQLEIEQRRLAETAFLESAARDQFRLKLSEALQTLADPVEIQSRAARMLAEYVGASRVLYGEVSDDSEHCTIHTDFHGRFGSLAGRYRIDDYGSALKKELQAGDVVRISDVRSEPRLTDNEKDRTAALGGFAAYLIQPLVKEGRLVALLFMSFSDPHAWSDDEAGLAAATAERTWSAVEQSRAERALRESEERLRLATAVTGLGTFDADLSSGHLHGSAQMRAILGLNGALPPAGSATVAVSPASDALDRIREMIRSSASECNGGAYESEQLVTLPDGSRRWVLVKGNTIFHGEGGQRQATRMVGVLLDITERRTTENTLRERERHIALIADASPALISYVDTDLRYRFVNRQYEVWFGNPREEIVGRRLVDVLGPQAMAVLGPHLDAALRGEQVHFELEMPYRTGGTRWIEARYAPDLAADGSVKGFFVWVIDTTERKESERQIQESEERFRTLADNMSQFAWMADKSGALFWYNKRWYEYTGTNYEQMQGWGWQRVHHPDHVDRVTDKYRLHLESGEPWEDTFPLLGQDGQYRWFLSRAIPIRDKDGRIIRWFGTNTDITERLGAEEALREADRRKDDFLATLAHELRNPLAPIRNAVEVLKLKGPAQPELVWGRDVIDRQVTHMARLLDDLLDVGRITRNKLKLRRERVMLSDIIASAVETSQPLIEAGRHQLVVDLPPEPVYVEADTVRMAQVFSNLLNNAAKYTERGGRIVLSVQRERCSRSSADEAVIRVKDTGIGIAAEQLPRIFIMFSQADRALDRSQGGLGIGLALAKGLVEMHGGTITARSEGVGQGSEFEVRLAATSGPVTEQIVASQTVAAQQGPAKSSRIVVADDNADSARSLALLLEMLGHEVRTALDGSEAVALIADYKPALALVDIGMPQMNGYEVAQAVRGQSTGASVRLVALTGWGQPQDKQQAMEAGFDAHMVKPVSVDDLKTLLNQLLAS